jgi:cyclopropane fatty-acyl-phospholipid synthase-like methyltransferase
LIPASPGSAEDPDASAVTLARRAGIGPGDVVLDAGCGVGGPAIAIARDLGAIVHGVTVSPVQVRLGRELADEAGVADRVLLHLADFHRLPFAAGRFDAVIVMEATCYSNDLAGLIDELARVLRPGGTLYVKDVFQRTGPLDDKQRSDLDRFHEIWACHASANMPALEEAMTAAGLDIAVSAELTEIGTDHFYAAMLEIDPAAGMRLNEMGRHFLQWGDVPIMWGEVVGRKPLQSSGTTATAVISTS